MILDKPIDNDLKPKWDEVATPFLNESEEVLAQYKPVETPPLLPTPSIIPSSSSVFKL